MGIKTRSRGSYAVIQALAEILRFQGNLSKQVGHAFTLESCRNCRGAALYIDILVASGYNRINNEQQLRWATLRVELLPHFKDDMPAEGSAGQQIWAFWKERLHFLDINRCQF